MDSNPIVGYEKVKVTEIPLSAFDSDYESGEEDGDRTAGITLGDNGFASDNNYGNRDRELMLATLTARQRAVTQLLTEGYSRIEIGQELGVCTQAVHQIVLRIRKRLELKAGISTKGWKARRGRY
jgi:DNA-directed RNA polymerase specialized sigma24 family protein